VKRLQVHLVHHDVPRLQRHPAHHHHGPLCVSKAPASPPVSTQLPPPLSRVFSSVAASGFGLIYLAMIVSVITNLLSFSPDEQALVGASPRSTATSRRGIQSSASDACLQARWTPRLTSSCCTQLPPAS
jgi:hypothetical protein